MSLAALIKLRIVQFLAQLDEEAERALIVAARAERRRVRQARRDEALRRIRAEMLPDLDFLSAAIEIDSAAHGLRAPRDDSEAARRAAQLRPAVRQRIEELCGSLDTVPRARRLRQIIGGK